MSNKHRFQSDDPNDSEAVWGIPTNTHVATLEEFKMIHLHYSFDKTVSLAPAPDMESLFGPFLCFSVRIAIDATIQNCAAKGLCK